MLATVGFAFIAGILSILSPCVLPLLPIVIGAAASQHRLGPLALSCGLAISFTAIGILVATVGFAVGLDASLFRTTAAILLVIIGAVLLVPAFQARFALAASPIGAWTENSSAGSRQRGGSANLGLACCSAPCGVLCRADARRGVTRGSECQQLAVSGRDDARVWVRGSATAAAARVPVPGSADALAGSNALGQRSRQTGVRRPARSGRRADPLGL